MAAGLNTRDPSRIDDDDDLNPAKKIHEREQQAAFDKDSSSKQEDSNIAKAREKEENPMGYTGEGSAGKKSKGGFFGRLKKTGPMLTVIGLLAGGGFGLTMIMSPGLMVIHMKEVLTDGLNDQIGASEVRSGHVMRSKLKGLQSSVGVCGPNVSIRCKFSSVGNKKLERLRNAGFEIDVEDSRLPGRSIPKKGGMFFVDSDGTRIPIDDPGKLYRLAGSNSEIRGALRKAFNPRFATLADATMMKVFSRIPGLHKRQKVPVTADKAEARKAIVESSRGDSGGVDKVGTADGDADDADDADGRNRANNSADKANAEVDRVRSSGTKAVSGGVIRGIGILGAADSICILKSTSRAIEIGAKVTRAVQLANFAMVVLTMADSMKASAPDLKPEQTEVVADMLTATDTREFINIESADPDIPGNISQPNPYFGKNAFDSNGFKLAAYNDTPEHNTGSIQFMLGGNGMLGVLAAANSAVSNSLSNAACNFVTSPVVRILGGVIGIGLGIASGGATIAVSVAASTAISAAIPYLENILIDILAGMAVDENTAGPEAGDAIFAGTAFMLGAMAQTRGLQPMSLKNKSSKSYFALNERVKKEHAEYETQIAKSEPFNIYNQYSLLGSFARKLIPTTTKVSSTGASLIGSVSSLFSTAATGLSPVATASTFNEGRFNVCNDSQYAAIGIDADAFCNVRYIMTDEELAMDSYANVEWMIENNQVDEESGDAISGSDYELFLKNCVDRFDSSRMTSVPFGLSGDDTEGRSDITDGSECIDPSSATADTASKTMPNISNFRVYTLDRSLQQSIDEEEVDPSELIPVASSDVIEVSGEWTNPMKPGTYSISSKYGMRTHPVTGAKTLHNGTDLAASYGTPYYAAADGLVTAVGPKSWGTNYITIDHGGGIVTEYGHSEMSQMIVRVDDQVKAGQLIGYIGSQGQSTGPHLHFNYILNGKALDPEKKMPEHGITL